mmetsp:Transcript_133805/g.286179  ORF Transcript_133805/g.286179 Transcript_133805/m.286179 type:complete len:226 (+) Transcript_133805:11-688(+)
MGEGSGRDGWKSKMAIGSSSAGVQGRELPRSWQIPRGGLSALRIPTVKATMQDAADLAIRGGIVLPLRGVMLPQSVHSMLHAYRGEKFSAMRLVRKGSCSREELRHGTILPLLHEGLGFFLAPLDALHVVAAIREPGDGALLHARLLRGQAPRCNTATPLRLALHPSLAQDLRIHPLLATRLAGCHVVPHLPELCAATLCNLAHARLRDYTGLLRALREHRPLRL